MNARWLLGLFLPSLLVARSVRADEPTECLAEAAAGQKLQATKKLVEARQQFLACSAATCPSAVRNDCANRYYAADHELPSVVIAAKNPTGADIAGVSVSIDGQPLGPRLDGIAVPVNAGVHMFHFESVGRPSVDQQVLVREGEKNQPVAVVLGSPAPTAAAVEDGARPQQRAGPWKTLGWGLVGAGIAGLGVGAVSGTIALVDKNGAHCEDGVCARGTLGAIRTAAHGSDVGWATGGVLLGGGLGLLLWGPRAGDVPAAGVRVAPVVAPTAAGIVARASW